MAERQRLDWWLHYVSSLTYSNIPGRWDLDIRYAWRPRKDLELAVVGQNLLHKQLPQFKSDNLASIQLQVQRSAQLNAKWQF
jgi:iron complex outermembrane receptor protein